MLASFASNARASTVAKLALAFTSLSEAHGPPPAASVTPAVGVPVLLIADTNRAPPVARVVNSLDVVEEMTKLLLSAHTNAPSSAACARRPAAKLAVPDAWQREPPGT